MAVTEEFIEYVRDLFADVPNTSIRKMFGGIGIFRHKLMFALSTGDGRIALKADAQTIPEFEAEGCTQWVYEAKTKKITSMGYWYMPERLADEPDEFLIWANKAFEAAIRADQSKPPSQQKLKI